MEQHHQQQPLLADGERRREEEHDKWGTYQFLGRSASVCNRVAGEHVSVDEIRSAASLSEQNSYYPPSIHGALVSYPEVDNHQDQAPVYQGGYGSPGPYPSNELGGQILDEVEIRQLLVDHVGHHCCWGSRPARRWKISAVEDCNVHIGTLETFIEERELHKETEPHLGKKIATNNKGQEPGMWEIDLRSEFPALFTAEKETKVAVPHSEVVQQCSGCKGNGEIACPTCNAGQEPRACKKNQMTQCPACYGRGLIAHRDGSDTICSKCRGKGMLPCGTCGSSGLIKCQDCAGQGFFVSRSSVLVKWRTLANRKVSAASGAASVPDEVFQKAKGVQLYNTQAYQCTPAFFADSYLLNRFSSDVIAGRSQIPPAARVICERHTISVVPVTRVTMSNNNQFFSFYVIGSDREIYIRNYPAKFCWGLCFCFEWFSL